MDDSISRRAMQEIIDRIGGMYPYRQIGNRESYSSYNEAWTDCINRVDAELNSLPSAQPDGIPLEWIDKHLEWLDNCDNDFAQLAKVGIRAMVEIWKKDKT